MHTMATIFKACGRVLIGLERIIIALLLMIGLTAYGLANYTGTQGVGTNFGSVVIGGVHFFSNLVCDFTTANQCAAVKAASTPAALTDTALVVQNAQEHIDMTAPLPDCGATPCTNKAGVFNQGQSVPVTVTLQSAAVANGNGTTLNTNGMSDAMLTVNCATCSGGTLINFEGSEDATNFAAINAVQIGTSTIATTTAAAGVTVWEMPVAGFQVIRARVSAYSAGTVTITGHTSPVPYSPKVIVTPTTTNAGAATVKGGVGVVNGGSTYQHVAASVTVTLQTLTGAIGDYLSHCVIYPSTTAAGSVTVFDNANAPATNVIEFVAGTLSNLAPITLPVGAVSTAGAWKVTTGANETVVCYGKFS
jgi:hypothetical protein